MKYDVSTIKIFPSAETKDLFITSFMRKFLVARNQLPVTKAAKDLNNSNIDSAQHMFFLTSAYEREELLYWGGATKWFGVKCNKKGQILLCVIIDPAQGYARQMFSKPGCFLKYWNLLKAPISAEVTQRYVHFVTRRNNLTHSYLRFIKLWPAVLDELYIHPEYDKNTYIGAKAMLS
jgi:hypothetical protein